MADNNMAPGSPLTHRRSQRLRAVGLVILSVGSIGAGIVYWTRPPDVGDDLSMLGFNKAEQRQMGQLYGKMGAVVDDGMNDLKRPGVQALIIAGLSALVAGGCFHFARLLENDDETH